MAAACRPVPSAKAALVLLVLVVLAQAGSAAPTVSVLHLLLLPARSYSDVAIHLTMMRGAGATMATHQLQAPDGTTVTLPDTAATYRGIATVLDLLRAVTPLAWARWITSGGKTGKYGPATAAMYGNNTEW